MREWQVLFGGQEGRQTGRGQLSLEGAQVWSLR